MAKKKSVRPKSPDHTNNEQATDATTAPTTDTQFETQLAEVETIVNQLESGELSLDDALKQYERGVSALRQCHEHLSRVERRVELLSGFDDRGRPVTTALDADELSLEEKQSARSRRRGAPSSAEDSMRAGWEIDEETGLF